jgi:hypothetical protein
VIIHFLIPPPPIIHGICSTARNMNDIKFDFSELFCGTFAVIVLQYELSTTCCLQLHTPVNWLAPSLPLRTHNRPFLPLYKTVSTSCLHSNGSAWLFKVEPMGCSEMSKNSCQNVPRNIPETRRFHLRNYYLLCRRCMGVSFCLTILRNFVNVLEYRFRHRRKWNVMDTWW